MLDLIVSVIIILRILRSIRAHAILCRFQRASGWFSVADDGVQVLVLLGKRVDGWLSNAISVFKEGLVGPLPMTRIHLASIFV